MDGNSKISSPQVNTKVACEPPHVSLPAHIKTNKTGPRILALSAVFIWGVIYSLGLYELTQGEQRERTPIDTALEIGAQHWGITATDAPQSCLGYFRTTLSNPDRLAFAINGQLVVPVFAKAVTTKLELQANFTSYRKLETISGTLSAGGSVLTIGSNKNDPPLLDLSITAPNQVRDLNIRRPEPIFLIERGNGRYSLRLPRHVHDFMQSSQEKAPQLSSATGLQIQPIDENGFRSCEQQLATVNDSFTFSSRVLDMGKLLNLIKLTSGDEMLRILHQGTI